MKMQILGLLVMVALVGCGKEQQQTSSGQPTVTPLSPQSNQSKVTQCQYGFSKEGLCASLTWQKGPSADENSSLIVKFWNPETSNNQGPFMEPSQEVKSFIQMQCCGSIFVPKVLKQSDGVYLVSEIRFLPGEWKLFVQLGKESDAEKVSLDVDLSR